MKKVLLLAIGFCLVISANSQSTSKFTYGLTIGANHHQFFGKQMRFTTGTLYSKKMDIGNNRINPGFSASFSFSPKQLDDGNLFFESGLQLFYQNVGFSWERGTFGTDYYRYTGGNFIQMNLNSPLKAGLRFGKKHHVEYLLGPTFGINFQNRNQEVKKHTEEFLNCSDHKCCKCTYYEVDDQTKMDGVGIFTIGATTQLRFNFQLKNKHRFLIDFHGDWTNMNQVYSVAFGMRLGLIF